jgi:hypothetical protein
VKVNEQPNFAGTNFIPAITDWARSVAKKLNSLASGAASAVDNTGTAAPTTGTWAQGDFVRNSSPSELGAVGSKYVIQGWMAVAGGTPGTWVQVRTLTGN